MGAQPSSGPAANGKEAGGSSSRRGSGRPQLQGPHAQPPSSSSGGEDQEAVGMPELTLRQALVRLSCMNPLVSGQHLCLCKTVLQGSHLLQPQLEINHVVIERLRACLENACWVQLAISNSLCCVLQVQINFWILWSALLVGMGTGFTILNNLSQMVESLGGGAPPSRRWHADDTLSGCLACNGRQHLRYRRRVVACMQL